MCAREALTEWVLWESPESRKWIASHGVSFKKKTQNTVYLFFDDSIHGNNVSSSYTYPVSSPTLPWHPQQVSLSPKVF